MELADLPKKVKKFAEISWKLESDKNLTGKVKMADMVKDHKNVDGYIMEAR